MPIAEQSRHDAAEIGAKVLSNRKPPYGIAGGLYDALKATKGDVLCVTNRESEMAGHLFLEAEEIDIHPAAAVAVASLVKSVKLEQIARDAVIMLNITGGGEVRYKADKRLYYLKPSFVFPPNADNSDVIAKVEGLFR